MVRSRLQWLRELVSIALFALRHPNRHQLLHKGLDQWKFMRENRLPVEYLTVLWPGLAGRPVEIDLSNMHHFELPYGERAIIGALVSFLRPMTIFEFGAFTGATTKLIADVMPRGAVIHTIDLPPDQIIWEDWIAGVIGQEFSSDPAYNEKIVLHRSSTRDFDFTQFAGKVDLVFIDASHEYDDVLHDSERALEILSNDGVIIWDDYQAGLTGVVSALNALSNQIQLVRIAHSRMVVHRRTPFPGLPSMHETPWTDFPVRGRPANRQNRVGNRREESRHLC